MSANQIDQQVQRVRSMLRTITWAPERSGTIIMSEGLLLGVEGLQAPVGAEVQVAGEAGPLACEVIGFRGASLMLMAHGNASVAQGARATLVGKADQVGVGLANLGRVADAQGKPLDGKGPIGVSARWPIRGVPLPPLARAEVTQPLATGVRAIDALFTLGRGQRIGLIAGSGVGKSTLMQQLVRGAQADVVVTALIGERGREIAGFVTGLGVSERRRTHVVAVPADSAAPLRIRGATRAFALAEWLRAQGLHVLLVLDSLTRVAHAQREIGLAAGEPAGLRGYPASALALIPALVERAGNDAASGGAITAVLTVLADGDDVIADPVVDTARGVLDGHIVLDRALAARGRFPAVDVGQSLSRTMPACVSPAHAAAAAAFRRDSALIEANRDLVVMGAYTPGQDPTLDRALQRQPALERFLAQPRDEVADFDQMLTDLFDGWGS